MVSQGIGAAVLDVRNVSKRFGAITALSDVSLSLHRGEILALLGDNGAGKSTLIKAMNGVNRLDEGAIFLDGDPIHNSTPQHVRSQGIETVHQDLALFDNLSATENLFAGREQKRPAVLRGLGVVRKRTMTARTRDILKELRVGIQDPNALIGLMSGGQRQAIAVARAHAFASKVVLLDEPTAALGVRESRAVIEVIRALPARGVSVILVSHNLEHVSQVADRAVVLRAGRIVGEAVPNPENHERLVSMIVGSVP